MYVFDDWVFYIFLGNNKILKNYNFYIYNKWKI